MVSNPVTKVTAEEYLALDRAAEFRSEFLDGEIIAMSGGSTRHTRLQMNLGLEIQLALRGTPCEAFNSDLRVRVSSRMYTYPDLSVVCGKLMLADQRQDILLNPTVVFEVLSPTTEHYDRGVKFQHYREVESLKDYILLAQNQVRIEQFTRGDDNTWTLRDYRRAENVLKIVSIGVSLPLASIYDRIEFTAE
jgi:Uma2 family endonuclease